MPRTPDQIVSDMVDSGLFSDDEIRTAVQQAKASAKPAAARASEAVAGAFAPPSLKEAALAGPASVLPGLTQATSLLTGSAVEASKDPRAIPTAMRVVPPVVAGVATGGMGFLPAVGAMGLTGAASEAGAQIAERMTGSPDAPKTSGEAALRIGVEGAKQAGAEAAGFSLLRLGKGLVNKIVKRAASKAAATGAPVEDLTRIYAQHPEVTKPGYFNERIDTFAADLNKGLLAKKAAASKAFDAASDASKQIAGESAALAGIIGNRAQELGLSASTKEGRAIVNELQKVVGSLVDRGKTFTFKDLADLDRAIYNASSGATTAPVAKKFAADISRDLEKFYDTAPARLRAARAKWREFRDMEATLEEGFGLDLASKKKLPETEKVVRNTAAFLSRPEDQKDIIRQATDYISPKTTERLEKLAAAGPNEGRLSANPPLIPTVGLGQAGYAMQNPASAAATVPIMAGGRVLGSPSFAGQLLRGAKAAERFVPGARKVVPNVYRGINLLFPGLGDNK